MPNSSRSDRQPTPARGGIRWDKIASIRDQIRRGTYDTPEKWAKLLPRLLDDLSDD